MIPFRRVPPLVAVFFAPCPHGVEARWTATQEAVSTRTTLQPHCECEEPE